MKLHINYLTFVSFMLKKCVFFFFAFLVLVETTSIWHVLCLRSLCNKVCAHRMNKRAKKRNYIAFVTLMMKYCEAVVWSISPKIKKERREPTTSTTATKTNDGNSEKTNDKRIEYATVRSLMSVVGWMYLFSVLVHQARAVSEPSAHRVARSQSLRRSKERNQWTWVRKVKHKGMRDGGSDGRRASGCYLLTSRSRHRVLVRSFACFFPSTFASSSSFFLSLCVIPKSSWTFWPGVCIGLCAVCVREKT